MKKISNFIYHNSDILVTLLIVAAVASVIYWRVDIVMHYSRPVSHEIQEHTAIDIDFSGIDLAPEKEPWQEDPNSGGLPAEPVSFDENFKSPAEAEVSFVFADNYQSAVRRTADAYGFRGEDYLLFYNLLWNKGVELGIDEAKIKAGSYQIPAGSSLEEILRIITNTKTE